MTYREQVKALYDTVNSDKTTGPYATPKGHHEAMWDAISLLATRMDGDLESNPREQREIGPQEFVNSREEYEDWMDEVKLMDDLEH